MRHGLFLPPFGPFGDPAVLVELAERAERAGWEGFFLWDHLMHRTDGDYLDAWLVLAAIAARTERIRLGPMVTPLPRRRPWKVAREAVTLDHLSAGRAVLGVGLGVDHSREFSAFRGEAATDRHRAELLDDGLEIITRLWTGEDVMFTGRHLEVTDVQFLPRPVQEPRIPIWCGARWPHRAPLRRAARYDGVVPVGELTPSSVAELLAEVHRHRVTREPFDVALPSESRAGDLPVSAYEDAGVTWWLESFQPDADLAAARSAIEDGPPT